ncbi:TetR/AcrR family transcriptional regulator [Lactobacillus sp. Sy-1]|uniref:TetR/AcrR family transcriptional regulator n=1 Tax=Lactobacillus sp. Sy-1 TaxID=2109645 RepID=UPI001C5BBAF1|nr:TetR/AcrR family transcriptional regulator [Lactobacillus sp. Sy-1]MBW1606386.1 TetR/AcrR family transcriptional regulator [Lactobacillus sp. Sy-1]
MDIRHKKSTDAIIHAFGELLTKQEYQSITVSEIISVAGISRSTFYAHFDTKDSLLEETCHILFEHVVLKLDNLPLTKGKRVRFESMITHVLTHIRKNVNNILDLLRGESSEIFLLFFKRHLKVVIGNQLDNKFKQRDLPKEYVLDFVVSSFVDTVNWWIKSGLHQSPELIESYYYAVTSAVI